MAFFGCHLFLRDQVIIRNIAMVTMTCKLPSVTDEMFVTHIVSTLTTLATSRLHGDNLNRARLLMGVMKCLQTVAKHNTSQYLLEQILSIVKGSSFILVLYRCFRQT